MSPRNHAVTLVKSQHYVIDSTNPGCALDDGIEHRLHVRRRAADDAEHFGRCRLMLQGFTQFRVALLQFFKQPNVLNGNDSLVGEGLESAICLSEKGWTSVRRIVITPIAIPSRSNGVAKSRTATLLTPSIRNSIFGFRAHKSRGHGWSRGRTRSTREGDNGLLTKLRIRQNPEEATSG